jgi:hypothetical protein
MSNAKKLLEMLEEKIKEFKVGYESLYGVVEPIAHGCKGGDMLELIDAYLALEKIKGMCEGMSKACNIHQPEIAELASKAMLANQLEYLPRAGFKVTPDNKTYVSVSKEAKPFIIHWLKADVKGRELVSEDYNANAFTAFIKERIEVDGYSKEAENEAFRIPASVSIFEKPILSLRKIKTRDV